MRPLYASYWGQIRPAVPLQVWSRGLSLYFNSCRPHEQEKRALDLLGSGKTPCLPCFPSANTSPETRQALPLGSGLDHYQWAGDNKLAKCGKAALDGVWKKNQNKTKMRPGFILNLQPNTLERAPNSGAEGAEWNQGGQAWAPSGMFPPPRQGRARHSFPCFTHEMSGTAVLAYCISSKKEPQAGFLGPIQIFEGKRFILQR